MANTFTKPKDVSRMRLKGEISDAEFAVINNMWGRGLKAIVDAETIEFHRGAEGLVAEIDREGNVARLYPERCNGMEESYFYGIAGHEDRRTPYYVERQ